MSGAHQLLLNFPAPVTVTSANVTTGIGSVNGFTISGPQVTVDLTGVTNAQTITLTLFGVSDGTNMGNVIVPMSVLAGDTNGNGSVNAGDVAQTKGKSGQAVAVANFRNDVNASGSINAGDVALTKSQSGTSLPS